MEFNEENVLLANKLADAMIEVIQDDKDILEKFPADMENFWDIIKGIFGIKFLQLCSQMDDIKEGAKEDKELAGILEFIKLFGVK